MTAGRVGKYRIAFVVGQTLGNAVYSKNLRAVVERDPEVEATWYFVDYPRWAAVRTPGSPNAARTAATRRAGPTGAAAKRLVRRAIGGHRQYELWAAWASVSSAKRLVRDLFYRDHDAVFFHTGSTALLSAPLIRDRAVISLDATPRVLPDSEPMVGKPPRGPIGSGSHRLHGHAYRDAAVLLPFSKWAKSSLVHDYGANPSRIHVVPPGIDLQSWLPGPPRGSTDAVKLLFVGRDFERKGGPLLLSAFADRLERGRYELDVVTKATLPSLPGLQVHNELPANSDALRRLYSAADIFVLPTQWDTFGIAAIEAMAAGLPVVASNLNALPEIVADGVSGILVPQRDGDALADAIEQLGADPALRRRMGLEGRAVAEQRFDLFANGRRVLEVLKQVADASRVADSPVAEYTPSADARGN
jgi:glycosyltransferase involved in cell wall biosynthesis